MPLLNRPTKGGKHMNDLEIFEFKKKAVVDSRRVAAVSYTHLDVYKRQL